MNKLREGLPELPPRMRNLPVSPKGYPVPWFVEKVNGEYDFRIMDSHKLVSAVKYRLCWACGESLGPRLTFVIGPMCTVNRVSAEPPLHYDCAVFSVKACPFLTLPKAQRREANMPENKVEAAGKMLMHNPGVSALWTCRGYETVDVSNGVVFRLGEPVAVDWFTLAREATRAEVLEGMEKGLPALREEAKRENAMAELESMVFRAQAYLPNGPLPATETYRL